MQTLALALILAAVACHTALAGETLAVRLKWSDVAQMIPGDQVSITTTAGGRPRGRVRAVHSDAIVLENGKASRIARSEVFEIRMTRYAGNGRRVGKLLGGTAGLVGGLVAAAVIGLKEGSAHRTGDKVMIGVFGIGGFPAGLLAGHYLGKLADKEVTIIHIIPDPAAQAH